MDRSFTLQRRLILTGIAVLVLADIALAGYSWHMATGMRVPMAQLEADSHKLQTLNADIERAEKIRHDLPATLADYDRFDASLLKASTGNSAVTSELDDFARKTGVQIQTLSFSHKEIPARGLTQVDMEASISGDYASIVKFMNLLQRSSTFYIVQGLTLQPEGQGSQTALRIGLHMKTFFRTAA
ncbi:MAG TPA: GspMb/PilO family protein [Dongiaceae bacterium]|nr:GspMb/PilO family protein [Dongiaceae bacterium]